MSTESAPELNPDIPQVSIKDAHDRFSELANRAAYAGEITIVTRGRSHKPAAAIVPMEWIRHYEELQDAEDLRIAMARLADLEAGRTTARPWDEVEQELGL